MASNAFLIALTNDIISFKKYLQELLTKVYASDSIYQFIEEDLIYITNSILEKIDEASGVITSEVIHLENIWSQNWVQMIAYSVNNAEFKQYPYEIINVYKDIVENIENDKVEVATVPENMFNDNRINFSFTPLWKIIDIIYHHLGKVGIKRQQKGHKLIKLAYPKEFKNDVFVAGIYSHEIGHYFERSRDLREEIFLDSRIFDKYKTELMPFIEKSDQAGNLVNINDIDYFKASYDLINSWLGEMFSDYLGIAVLGPAFILSNMEYDLHNSYSRTSYISNGYVEEGFQLSHPSRSFRSQKQIEYLRKIVDFDIFSSAVENELDKVIKYFSSYKAVNNNGKKRISNTYVFDITDKSKSIVMNMLTDYLPIIEKSVESVVGNLRFKEEVWKEAIDLANDKLVELVPPCEYKENNADSISIINAAWIARIEHYNELKKKIEVDLKSEQYEIFAIINDLTLFALNSARIMKRWIENGSTK